MLCLISLVVSRAVYNNAFETPFKSLNEIPNLLDLQYTGALDLPWKEEKANKLIRDRITVDIGNIGTVYS